MKKGFTLVEMMAIVIIIALISLTIMPSIINQISSRKSEVDKATKQMIYEATDLYLKNKETDYPKLSGNTYCITLDTLVKNNYLQAPIKDFTTGEEISLTKKVKIRVNEYKEYDNFELADKC